jgi:hypothetical protein
VDSRDGEHAGRQQQAVEVRLEAGGEDVGGVRGVDVSGGHSGHSSSWGYAYNMVENINGASGSYGNGVSSTNLTGTLDIKPIPNNVVLRAWIVYPLSSGALPELWVSYENGIDGGCS